MKGLTRQIVVLLSCALMIYVNFFVGSSGDFEGSGPETGASATSNYDMFPTAISPAPYTFTIWLPIFLGLVVFAIYQALPAQRGDERFDALGLSASAAFIANSTQALGPIWFNTLSCIIMLIALFFVFRTLVGIGLEGTRTFALTTRLPLFLFFGWMTVATILSISQLLVSLGWAGFGIPATLWGALLILIAASIAFFIVWHFGAITYSVAIMWGFWGIVALDLQALPIVIVTLIATAALVWSMVRAWRSPGTPGTGTRPASA